MAKSIKPTLIMLAVIATVILLPVFGFMWRQGLLTVKNVAVVILIAPLAVVIFVLMHKDNAEQYGVLTNEQKAKDSEKYLDNNDTQPVGASDRDD